MNERSQVGSEFPGSVVLADVSVGPFEKLYILMKLILQQTLPQRLFDFPFSRRRLLPTGEPHKANDLVDVLDDFLHDHGHFFALHLLG